MKENIQKTESRRQEREGRRQEAEVRGQTAEVQRRINAGWLRLWRAVFPNTPPPTARACRVGAIPILALLTAALAILTAGCQLTTYHGPNGERFVRGSFGAKTAISSLSVEAGTNGIRRLEMRGYQNDTSQALGAVTEAAVKAAIQGVK